MKQSIIAGLVLCVMGIAMIGAPRKLWEITEKWKSQNADRPSKSFLIVIRIVGAVFILFGILLASGLVA